MTSGLLWYDVKDTLDMQVTRAAERYAAKYGRWPNICYVSPATLANWSPVQPVTVQVMPDCQVRLLPRSLPVGHLWIGVEA